MRSIAFILILSISFGLSAACSRKPAGNAESNANAEAGKENPFANVTDPNAALAEGNRLLDDNQTELAIDAFKQAVKLDPDLAEAYFKMGIAYALIETEMTREGVDINPTANADGKKAGQQKTSSQKAFEKAVAAYKKLLGANPKDDIAQFNLGRAYNKLNNDDDAEEAFRQAVKLKPDDTEYQTELGAILIKLAKYHEAIPPLKRALELDAENSRAENLLDDAEAGAKRIDFAQADKKANSNSNMNANANVDANSSTTGNTTAKPANVNTRPKKEEPKDKKPERPATKPNN
jgi:tetratricopeptide (TPR) repeat protein